MKTVFTTGEAAKLCKISQQTIIRCFDNGQLKGFRVPGSRFRRIPREALLQFMKDNGIPTDVLEKQRARIIMAGFPPLTHELYVRPDADVNFVQSGFEAAIELKEAGADAIVVYVTVVGMTEAQGILDTVRRKDDFSQVVLCMYSDDNMVLDLQGRDHRTELLPNGMDVGDALEKILHSDEAVAA